MGLERTICREAVSKAEKLFRRNPQAFEVRDAYHHKTGLLRVKINGFELVIDRYDYYKIIVYPTEGSCAILYVMRPRIFGWLPFGLHYRIKSLFVNVEAQPALDRERELKEHLKGLRAI